ARGRAGLGRGEPGPAGLLPARRRLAPPRRDRGLRYRPSPGNDGRGGGRRPRRPGPRPARLRAPARSSRRGGARVPDRARAQGRQPRALDRAGARSRGLPRDDGRGAGADPPARPPGRSRGGAAKISGAGAVTGDAAGSLLLVAPEAESPSSWPFLARYARRDVALGARGLQWETPA